MTKKLGGEWSRKGKAAEVRDLAEAVQLARLHRRKATRAEREAGAMDAQARRVGAAARRAVREQQARTIGWLTVRPKRESGRNSGQRRLPRFEAMTGLSPVFDSNVGADRLSSFHFQWRSRGLRPRKGQKNSHAYRRGEIVRLVKYILRDAAREVEGGGIVSSISDDPDEIASVLGAVEELEMAAGQKNANVYISMVISLPHELDTAGRERALTRIVEAFKEEELPFAAVLHKPDPGTDQRNFHAHVVLSLRPFRKKADGRYSFAALPSADLNDGDWIYPLRGRIAAAINEEMARLEVETGTPQRVFTHLSNADRGLPPKSKAQGKHGPGIKAADRRAVKAEAARAEIALQQARLTVLDELAGLITGLVSYVPIDVAAMVSDARHRVAQKAEALAAAARASEIKARIARLARTTRWHRSIESVSPGPVSAQLSREGLTSLGSASSLGKVPSPGQAPSLGSIGVIPNAERQVVESKAAPQVSRSGPQPSTTAAEVQGQSTAVTPSPDAEPVPTSPMMDTRADPTSRSIHHETEQPDSLEHALALAADLRFLPLRPDRRDGRPTRYLIDREHAVITDLATLQLVHRHLGDTRMQRLLQGKYASMQQAVLAELTISRSSKPSGKILEIFDRDPQLAAAVRSAWGYVSLMSLIDEARAYWDVREAEKGGSTLAASTDENESTLPNESGLTAEELLGQMKGSRGPGR